MASENKALIFNVSKKKSKKIQKSDQQELKFCDQILLAVAIIDKKLSIFILIFFNSNSSFLDPRPWTEGSY